MILEQRIIEIHESYLKSVFELSNYVRDIEKAVKDMHARSESICQTLEASKAGKPNPIKHPPDTKLIAFELEEKELDLLKEVMNTALLRTATVYPTFTFRMAFVYLIALFDSYLSDIFEAVVKSRPEMLRSKKQIAYEKILDFACMEDLIDHLAKRELNELSYKSIKEQAQYYKEKFGLIIDDSGVSIDMLVEYRSRRNLLIHNNGIINHTYLDLIPITSYQLGDSVVIDSSYFNAVMESLNVVTSFIKLTLTTKYAN